MSRRLLSIAIGVFLVTSVTLGYLFLKPLACVKVVIRDDDGLVAGVPVITWGRLKWENSKGVTDQSGIAEIVFRSFSGVFEIDVEKDGYYLPTTPRHTIQFHRRGRFAWEPWPTNAEVTIRKIGNPVAMYAKNTCARIDVFGQRRGYDLVVGDWVAPYGVGKTNDFFFELRRQLTPAGRTNELLYLAFANSGDGIQSYYVPGSGKPKLPIPALAPVDDYRSTWKTGDDAELIAARRPKMGDVYAELNYYFRVRTRTGADGKVTGGYYGKIYDGILFETDPNLNKLRPCSPGIYFTYYLNPDGTRNTEYSGQNLLQGEGTQVRSP